MSGPLEWMAWTTPTAIFFIAVFLMLGVMTTLGMRKPSYARKGFLPLTTTRGDRLYIGLIVSLLINLGWFLATDATPLGAVAISIVWMTLVLRWG
jgi:predicted small integral membrane protein